MLPGPADTMEPVVSGSIETVLAKAFLMADRWLQPTWYMSPPKFSAANFQLQGMVHLNMPPNTSTPPSRRSKKLSKYQVISPR